MNTTIQCIILLACTAICTSATIKRCHCVKTISKVNRSLITDVKEIDPLPYCNKKEVIVTLKDNSQRCLDPNGRFTKGYLQWKRAARVEKIKTTSPETATVSATAVQTSS
ncbi:permeability factor 2-like isoform X3 [Micropterus salmoides]|uniref:permeability factor 2-like isoform X3 n=1 Tax=Micropterus salmoides TaxID=27706 RepID=UPI0018EAA675|nr:permeability factor 2-like isoform X3 [Micropterus salmoides]